MRDLASFTHLLNTPEDLAEAVASYAEVEANQFSDIDEDLVPILKNLNYVPGLATRFCCGSYPEEKIFLFYITFVTNESGLVKVLSMFDGLLNKLNNHVEPNPEERTAPWRENASLVFGVLPSLGEDNKRVNAVTLRVCCKTSTQKAWLIKALLELSSTIHA